MKHQRHAAQVPTLAPLRSTGYIFFVALLFSRAALYLEKLGEDHLQEALREMDDALTRMAPR